MWLGLIVFVVIVVVMIVTGFLETLPSDGFFLLGLGGWLLGAVLLWFVGAYGQAFRPIVTHAVAKRGMEFECCFHIKQCWFYVGLALAVSCYGAYWGNHRLNGWLPVEFEGKEIVLEGKVSSIPRSFEHRKGQGVKFEFDVAKASLIEGTEVIDLSDLSLRVVRLSWYLPKAIKAGSHWQLLVKLKRPHGLVNPGGFDLERWLLNRDVGAVGYVRSSSLNRSDVVSGSLPLIKLSALKVRDKLKQRVNSFDDVVGWAEAGDYVVQAPINDKPSNVTGSQFGSGQDINARVKSLVVALLIGDKSQLIDSDRNRLQRLGLSHLLAISGLHVGLAASFGFFLGSILGRILILVSLMSASLRSFLIRKNSLVSSVAAVDVKVHTEEVAIALGGRRPRSVASGSVASMAVVVPIISVLCSWCAAMGYACLAGLSVPTQRAMIMLSVWVVTWLSAKRFNAWLPWWVSMALVLLVHPLSFYEAGFWLSFGAVAVLLLTFSGSMSHRRSAWLSLLKAQVALFFGMACLQGVWGYSVSLVSPLANIMAVPFVSVLVVPMLLASVISLGVSEVAFEWLMAWVFWLVGWFVNGIDLADSWVQWQGGWGLLSLDFSDIKAWPFNVMASLATIILLLPVPWLLRVMPVCMMFAAIFIGDVSPKGDGSIREGLSVSVLDVGQGLAVAIHTETENWVFDTGKDFHVRSVLQPYFDQYGIDRLDGLIVSHGDSDHAGGLEKLVRSRNPKQVWANGLMAPRMQKLASSVSRNDAPPPQTASDVRGEGRFNTCHGTKGWRSSGVHFTLIGVPIDLLAAPSGGSFSKRDRLVSDNNHSCVLLLEYQGVRVLIPGDVERVREELLLLHDDLQEPVDILVAPHHGSMTSSSKPFVTRLDPAYVFVSSGYRNRYGHPHPQVVGRYLSQGADVLLTSEEGALMLKVDRDGLYVVNVARDQPKRYWSRR